MGSTDWLYYLVDVVGVILLGLTLALGMLWTSRRKRDAAAQVGSAEATRRLYEEEDRVQQEKDAL